MVSRSSSSYHPLESTADGDDILDDQVMAQEMSIRVVGSNCPTVSIKSEKSSVKSAKFGDMVTMDRTGSAKTSSVKLQQCLSESGCRRHDKR